MASPILGSVLKALERLYSFRSAQKGAPEDFELELPIQPVHDLSKIAVMGSAIGPFDGFWVGGSDHIHTAVNTIESTPFLRQPAAVLGGYPPDPSFNAAKSQTWYYNGWVVHNDGTDFAYATIAIVQSNQAVGPVGIGTVTAERQLVFDGVASTLFGNMVRQDQPTPKLPIPMLINPGAVVASDAFLHLLSRSDTAGTVTYEFNYMFWLGAKGVPPPY